MTTKSSSSDKSFSTETPSLYLTMIQEELRRRASVNSSYSLRAFARQLGVDASLFSKILKGSRPLPPLLAKKILISASWSPQEKRLFWHAYKQDREQIYGELDPENALFVGDPSEFDERPVSHDLFHLIAEPHHYALAELMRVRGAKFDARWMGERLGVPESEVPRALDRLLKVGILRREGKKIVRAPGRHTTTQDRHLTNAALKLLQRRILEQAVTAMDEVPIDDRCQNSMTVAVNPKKLPVARKMIAEFINQLTDVLESGPLDEVYQVSISLFPATKPSRKTGAKTSEGEV